jgi:hypothetical protein
MVCWRSWPPSTFASRRRGRESESQRVASGGCSSFSVPVRRCAWLVVVLNGRGDDVLSGGAIVRRRDRHLGFLAGKQLVGGEVVPQPLGETCVNPRFRTGAASSRHPPLVRPTIPASSLPSLCSHAALTPLGQAGCSRGVVMEHSLTAIPPRSIIRMTSFSSARRHLAVGSTLWTTSNAG